MPVCEGWQALQVNSHDHDGHDGGGCLIFCWWEDFHPQVGEKNPRLRIEKRVALMGRKNQNQI